MTSNACKLLKSLGLPPDTTCAKRWLRANKKIVVYNDTTEALVAADPSTVDGKFDTSIYTLPQSGHYSNSIMLAVDADGVYKITSDTIVDGDADFNFSCKIRANGKVVSGMVNTFAFGMMRIDQGYMDELLEEWAERKYAWDVIVRADSAEEAPAKRAKIAAADEPADESTKKEVPAKEKPMPEEVSVPAEVVEEPGSGK